MDALAKLQLLGPATRYEPAEEVGIRGTRTPPVESCDVPGFIHKAVMPNGKRIALLKTLLTSACERDCFYCPFRNGRDFQRATFEPDELARLFLRFHRRGVAEGIFLSSALAGGGPRTQERLVATAESLRRRYGFRGYIHLKIMPGAEREQVAMAMTLANRVSVNLEAPNDRRLALLAPHKRFSEELVQRLRWVQDLRQEMANHRPSSTTQFVVGAAGESDLELLATTAFLYSDLGLARTYFSGFRPVPDTPLQDLAPSSPRREHRLYQASFLLRDYGYDVEELPFHTDGNLPLDTEPKLAWARQHLTQLPIEINQADRRMLLRVPGIGPKGAQRVLAARRQGTLRELSDLRKLGIVADRAAPYILLDGHQPARQLSFWPAGGLNA